MLPEYLKSQTERHTHAVLAQQLNTCLHFSRLYHSDD